MHAERDTQYQTGNVFDTKQQQCVDWFMLLCVGQGHINFLFNDMGEALQYPHTSSLYYMLM